MIDDATYIPEWATVQRVIELVQHAGGRLRTEAHLPQRVRIVPPKRKGAVPGVIAHTSGCKMHARIDIPDPEGPNNTTVCAVCDAPDLFPRVARDLYA